MGKVPFALKVNNYFGVDIPDVGFVGYCDAENCGNIGMHNVDVPYGMHSNGKRRMRHHYFCKKHAEVVQASMGVCTPGNWII